jgi:hypothetical protein
LPIEIGKLESLVELDVVKAGALLRLPDSICLIHTLETLYIDPTVIIPGCLNGRYNSRFRIVTK